MKILSAAILATILGMFSGTPSHAIERCGDSNIGIWKANSERGRPGQRAFGSYCLGKFAQHNADSQDNTAEGAKRALVMYRLSNRHFFRVSAMLPRLGATDRLRMQDVTKLTEHNDVRIVEIRRNRVHWQSN